MYIIEYKAYIRNILIFNHIHFRLGLQTTFGKI